MKFWIYENYKDGEKTTATPKEVAEYIFNTSTWKNRTYNSYSKYAKAHIKNTDVFGHKITLYFDGTEEEFTELEKLLFRKIDMTFPKIEDF